MADERRLIELGAEEARRLTAIAEAMTEQSYLDYIAQEFGDEGLATVKADAGFYELLASRYSDGISVEEAETLAVAACNEEFAVDEVAKLRAFSSPTDASQEETPNG